MIFGYRDNKIVNSSRPSSFPWIGAATLLLAVFVHPDAGRSAAYPWQQREGYSVAELPVPAVGKTGFTLVGSAESGITFTNALPDEKAMDNQNLLNGAGVALGDFDGDGLCDIYFCNLNGHNVLYRNLGAWKFEDVTDAAGVRCANRASTGATFADVNGDGWLDLIVTSCGGPNVIFINDGHGHFTEQPLPPGIVTRTGSTSIALADIDGDGDLDLYVANYGETSLLRGGGTPATKIENGKAKVIGRWAKRIRITDDGKMIELGEPHVLYLNDGKGNFTPASWTDGTFLDEDGRPLAEAPWDLGLSVMFRDLNQDGFPDLYVCNDFQTPDRIWMNDGKGHFRAANRLAIRHTSNFSMSVDVADISRDGHDDIFTADMLSRFHRLVMSQIDGADRIPPIIGEIEDRPQIRQNVLLRNRGDGTYADIGAYSGLAASDWTWCAVFLDVDLDGYEDLLIANGHAFDTQDMDTMNALKAQGGQSGKEARLKLLKYPRLATPNYVFRNRGDLTFEETGTKWGFDSRQVCHGMALADLDNDGDLDVVVNSLNGPALIYRNETAAPRVAVRLKGKSANTQGIGAKVALLGGAVPRQSQEIICGGRYLSGDDPMRVFAAGSLTNRMSLEVVWRSGQRSLISEVQANHIYEVDEAGAQPFTPPAPPVVAPWFEDVSARLGHIHHQDGFDDFARQPLLPRRLSQLGPGVGWFDLEGTGHEDLLLGSGKGGQLTVFHNDGQGKFSALAGGDLAPLAGDLSGVVGWIGADGRRTALAGLSNYEDGDTNQITALGYLVNEGKLVAGAATSIPGPSASSAGPLAVADVYGDGTLALFMGGRVVPGRYPEGGPSWLWRSRNGRLEVDAENSQTLATAGMVSGAVFSDVNGDGWPDLILACEWRPVRVFLNDHGKLHEATAELGLSGYTGWWNGVTTGDVDGDGRLDIIASNWGLNSPTRASPSTPARLYYGDFEQTGRLDMLEAYDDSELGKVVPRRNLNVVGGALPFVRQHLVTHRAYGEASVAEILGEAFARAKELRATTLASTVFLNRGDHFEAVPLPAEAQFAPGFGVCVADVDGDGKEDLFLSQNFFATRTEDARLDGGRGLWLRGDGRGGFTPVPGQVSGVKVYGEQRGCATGDFDEDGRVDFVVSQDGAETKLYHNVAARPGLRVRPSGPVGNPDGIGVVMRLTFATGDGQAREVHGGSGYWSQDAPTQVLGTPSEPSQITARWPGGKSFTYDLPRGAREVTLDPQGNLKVTK